MFNTIARSGLIGLAGAALVLSVGVANLSADKPDRVALDVPYVPTPQPVVDKMLEMAGVNSQDFVIDLGSGDGRILVTAAQKFGVQGFGVDLNPQRISEARENAKSAGVADKIEFHQKNLFDTNLGEASVLTLYLLSEVNLKLRPKILAEMKPGSRVVSHAFDMGTWLPDEKTEVASKTVYKWTVPANVEGRWEMVDSQSNAKFDLQLQQSFQKLSGEAVIDGTRIPLGDASVDGDRIAFALPAGNGTIKRFEGRWSNGRIEGQDWQAARSS